MSGERLAWSEIRDRAVERFGSFPPMNDEHELLEAFQRSPEAVVSALEHVTERYATGQVRAPWRVWVLECRTRGDAVVELGPERSRRVAQAEAWLRVAGGAFPTWAEVADELGLLEGSRSGTLAPWAGDPILEATIRDAWERARPGFARGELEAEARALEWRREMDVQGRFVAREGEAGADARRRLAQLATELEAAA